jgi:thioredoxin-related protein
MVLGINVPWDKEQLVRTFMDVYKVSYPVGRDATGAISKLYDVEATPTNLFIDKTGRLVEQHVGGMEETAFAERVERLLK